MKIRFSQNLIRLARLFEKSGSLFATGEYVFNSLCNKQGGQIELVSSLSVEEVFSLVENTEFVVKIKNAKVNEIEIVCEGERFIYLPFDKIERSVEAALLNDSLERGFTINAIYYKILSNEFYDVCGGLKDLKNKVLKCCDANTCFINNGLNILKAVYLSSLLGYQMNSEMVESIQRNVKSLKNVSGERKCEMLNKILLLNGEGLIKALSCFARFDLFKYVVLVKGYNLKLQPEVFELTKACDKNYKLLAFLIDYYNYLNSQKQLSIKQFVTYVVRDQLKMPINFQKQAVQVISGFLSYDLVNLDFYIANNISNIEILLHLFGASSKKGQVLNARLSYLKDNKVPLSVNELKISFKEIYELCKDKKKAGKVQGKLLYDAILNPSLNSKEKLIKQVIKYI